MGPGALASGGDPNSADDADDHFNDGISSIPYHFTPSIAFLKETVCLLGIPPALSIYGPGCICTFSVATNFDPPPPPPIGGDVLKIESTQSSSVLENAATSLTMSTLRVSLVFSNSLPIWLFTFVT